MAKGDRRIEYLPLSKLRSATRNPKEHAGGEIEASVGRFGFVEPMVLDDRTGKLVAGHGRRDALLALQKAGGRPPGGVKLGSKATEWLVPVIRGWRSKNTREAEAYLLASNRLVEAGGWDNAELERMLVQLARDGGPEAMVGLDITPGYIEALLREADTGSADVVPETPTESWVKFGDLFALGDHRLLCGDSTNAEDVGRLMVGERAICLTDPPYGIGLDYGAFVDTQDNLRDQWIYPSPKWVICWFYGGGQLRSSWGFNCWQPFLCYGKDPSLASGNGARPDAIDMNTPANSADINHPCPKPIALWEWFIERLSFTTGDLFFDPFCGSGTTIITAERMQRRCYGIELEPRFCQVIIERWEKFTGRKHEKLS